MSDAQNRTVDSTSADSKSVLGWDFTSATATANVSGWSAKLNPVDPVRGLEIAAAGNAELGSASWLTCITRPLPKHRLEPEEVYARQSDLIARFDQSEQDDFAFQLDYRLLPESETSHPLGDAITGGFGLEFWVSIQTDDLDSCPTLEIACKLPTEAEVHASSWRVFQHAELASEDSAGSSASASGESHHTAAAFVATTSACTTIWMIEPTDQQHAELKSTSDDAEQCVELFGHFMEKGVIRRARMRFYAVRGKVSNEQLRALYQAFAESPLPLTA